MIMSEEGMLVRRRLQSSPSSSSSSGRSAVMNGSWIPSHLQITVLQARDLALKSKSVNSEVYVTVQLDKEKVSTTLLNRHTDPIWNQTFKIPLMSFQSILEVQVRQKSKFVDEHIGQIRVSINNLTVSKTLRKSWYKLAAKPGKTSTKIRGDILLATSFLSNWDTKESASSRSIIDFDLPESSGKMLSRSKSEYKSKSKNSPKSEKQHKTKSVFDRIRKNKSTAAFEECEDFLVSMRTPGSPPTPPAGSERVKSTTLTRSGSNGDHSSSVGNTSTDFQEMFSEATQLEKKGILDLSLVDPKTRVELGKQRFESTLIEDSEGRQDNEDLDVSPIPRSYSFRHKRPLRTQSLSIKTISSHDSDPTHQSHTPPSVTTSTSTTTNSSPKSVTTYRATSMRRKKKMRSGGGSQEDGSLVSVEGSTTSVEGVDSTTSEYYSSTTLDSTSHDVKMNGSLSSTDHTDSKSPSTVQQPLSESKRITEEQTKKSSDNSTDGKFLQAHDVKREKSVPTETQTLQREEVQLRKNRRRFASETFDRNRHSADIESLLRLTANAQGKNDGLGNVLDTQKINKRLKQKQLTIDRTPPESQMASSLSQPSTTYHAGPVTRSTSHAPLHMSPPITVSHDTLRDSSPGLISPTDSDRSDLEPPSINSQEDQSSLYKTESLPVIKRTYWDTRPDPLAPVYPKHVGVTPLSDKASFFESEGSSSTASVLYPPSNVSSSLDSSFSSDYASLSNNRRIDDDNPSDSQCTTPTETTPTITREGTPSPQEQSPLIENVKIGNDDARLLSNKRLQHTFNKSSLAISKENISPLPPSLQYSTLPTRGKYANSVKSSKNTTAADLSAAVKVLAPYESKDAMNVRAVNLPPTKYSLSASNSGRTSPVIEENEEEDIQEPPTPVEITPPQNIEAGTDSIYDPKPSPIKPTTTDQPKSSQLMVREHKRLSQASSYEPSGSPQRRRPSGNSGGGLKKAISLYQDSKRSTTGAGGPRRALFREESLDTGKDKSNVRPSTQRATPRKLPSTGGMIKKRSREETQNKSSLSSKQSAKNNTSKTIDTEADAMAAASPGSQFDLPPPPDISHTVMAEQLCGMNQEDNEDTTRVSQDHTPSSEGAALSQESTGLSSTDKDWKSSSQSTVATSSDEYEDLLEDELHRLSKQELVHLVIDINEKFKKCKHRMNETQSYLDSLLVKVMDHHPELLAL